MYKISYAIPVVALIIAACIGIDPEYWWAYLLIVGAMEGLIGWAYYEFTRAKEYLSGYVTSVSHFFPWVEKVVKKETKYDEKGNSYTVEKVEYVEHPDEWNWSLNTGRSQSISEYTFNRMCGIWQTGKYYFETYQTNKVSGGGGESCHWNGIEEDTETVTYTHKYKNPVRYSNSLFNSHFLTDNAQARQLGLFDYPAIHSNDQEVILYHKELETPLEYEQANIALQRLNAFMGKACQIHVFILLFKAEQGMEIAQKQRDYWKGLNKNEFVVCLGVNGQEVEWCQALSWMDVPVLGVKTEAYFREYSFLDLLSFVKWLRENLDSWKRKEFKDFEYLGTNMSKGHNLSFWLISLSLGLLVFFLCLIIGG